MISSNCTAYLQSLDIGVNKSFKSHLSNQIEEYISDPTNYTNGKLRKMDIDTMTNWIKSAANQITSETILNACRAGGIPAFDEDFNINATYIATHERLGQMFIEEYDKSLDTVSMEDFLANDRQFDEDKPFEINLGNDFVVQASDRVLRNNPDTQVSIYRQQCEERASECLEDANMDDMADYICCFCKVEMLKVQWHTCSECGNHVHSYGIGCMDQEERCKNCSFSINKGL